MLNTHLSTFYSVILTIILGLDEQSDPLSTALALNKQHYPLQQMTIKM